MGLPLPRNPTAASFPATVGELVQSFQRGEQIYDSHDAPPPASQPGVDPNSFSQTQDQLDQQAQPAARNGQASSLKAIQTRKGKFGPSKLHPDTKRVMQNKGFNIDQTKNPSGRAKK